MSFHIITDSCCDFTAEQYRQMDTVSVPLSVMWDGQANGDCPQDAALLERILREDYGVKNILTGYVGPILGAHTGHGVLGLFHLGTGR